MEIRTVDGQDVSSHAESELPVLLKDSRVPVWVDMVGPSPDDVDALHSIFGFHPLAIEDTRNQRQRPKLEEYHDHLFLILNSAAFSDGGLRFRELDVFVRDHVLVTVHPDDEPVLTEFMRRLTQRHATLPVSASYLLYRLLDALVDSYFPALDHVATLLDRVEQNVLLMPDQTSFRQILKLKRALLNLWRALVGHREVLVILTRQDLPHVEHESLRFHLRDVADHLAWIAETASNYRDMLNAVTELYMSSASNRLNRVVHRLTIFTVVFGALAVITGFYGMNFTRTLPAFSNPWGVPLVLGAMLSAATLVTLLLRRDR